MCIYLCVVNANVRRFSSVSLSDSIQQMVSRRQQESILLSKLSVEYYEACLEKVH